MNRALNALQSTKSTRNLGLKHRNTFGFEVSAELAYDITVPEQIPEVMSEIAKQKLAWRVLGGGSNVILPKILAGATLLMNIAGQEIISADDKNTYLSVGGGVNWHEFVAWTLEHDLPGLENLALIPGTVGAAPIQNIGAYGVEVAEYIDSIIVFDVKDQAFVTLTKDACCFAYRDSYFKQNPQRFIVTQVVFKIPKSWKPRIHYADLAKQFFENANPSPEDIFLAVCKIRTHKLPDPKVIGNAGSFFQNPIIPIEQFEALLKKHVDLVSYPDLPGKRKLAAGWLIDQCGFKGQRLGSVGVYENQALVLVNHGGGTAQDVLSLAQSIQDKVRAEFGVSLVIEPNLF
ncbi:UDP-N-acetylmuramate dehydrogenase [Polynucleobacter sp. MWH-Aus1W21]|uniref:UDP-N-acetylmuramate dehydrogenase n=1 Tax=Polynucleobacter sp. MWH-Aus1W21 TaxID=1855880 RepID=UPI001BFD51E5|nr:UDP-N-acetylmuramate dehydrogenase [Polynucleobacter sp. MWH-Aus1W21]QWD66532.1 UDP-N-acetylmuramate dehydrogenase [Polynucleobacter sp. MWH-Aus1W21]